MREGKGLVRLLALVMSVVMILSACKAEPEVIEREVTREVVKETTREVVKEVTKEVPKEVTRLVSQEVTVVVPATPVAEIPFATLWVASGHADVKAEAFNHWNEATPPVVPKACAKCHSEYGYLDFLGVDGTAAGTVENDAKIGSVITCVTCHNTATEAITSVILPSGVEIKGLGAEARCMQCHQGRASTATVDQAIAKVGLKDLDTVSADLGFTNIHYFAAAATLVGGMGKGGYQYEGKAYDGKLQHVAGFNTCVGCHNPHSLELRLDACAGCHKGVSTKDDLKNIRMQGSLVDYDGDGDLKEGIYNELVGLRDLLHQAIQAYGNQVSGTSIVYDAQTYPYFFADTNKNGQLDKDEAVAANGYKAWTARLAKAAYNYQTSIKDPGAFAHGGKYIIQLLYDSTADLNSALKQPVDLSRAHRDDAGHFAGSEEPFRHWDAEGVVPATCSKCHSATGLPFSLKEGAAVSQPPASGLACSTCHDSLTDFTRYQVANVTFPSGAAIDSGNPDTNLCMNCHQGRESTVSVDKAIGDLGKDVASDKLRFRDAHYFAAGASLFGTEAKGAYEYAGKTYLGRNKHVEAFSNCSQCHLVHELAVKVEACAGCHQAVKTQEDLRTIRMSTTDYDGDGDVKEGIAGEVFTFQEALYAAMQAYATQVLKAPVVYSATTYPYFFKDTNGNGQLDPDEALAENGYNAWSPRLLQAAYNYQYVVKDPGAFAHNGKYIIQVLYDSLEDLGGAVTVNMKGMTRP